MSSDLGSVSSNREPVQLNSVSSNASSNPRAINAPVVHKVDLISPDDMGKALKNANDAFFLASQRKEGARWSGLEVALAAFVTLAASLLCLIPGFIIGVGLLSLHSEAAGKADEKLENVTAADAVLRQMQGNSSESALKSIIAQTNVNVLNEVLNFLPENSRGVVSGHLSKEQSAELQSLRNFAGGIRQTDG